MGERAGRRNDSKKWEESAEGENTVTTSTRGRKYRVAPAKYRKLSGYKKMEKKRGKISVASPLRGKVKKR